MKVKTFIFVYYVKYSWEAFGLYQVYPGKLQDDEHRTFINQQEIEIEVPDNYDPRPSQIAALEQQKKQAATDYHKSVAEINDRINKLTAIEFAA